MTRDNHGTRNSRYKHGMTGTSEFWIWQHMRKRCHDEGSKDFSRYGGRGIQVCERWRDSFDNFFADMGKRPSDKHSIDRINNDGNYEPSNCRWATRSEQRSNQRLSSRNRSGVKHIGVRGDEFVLQIKGDAGVYRRFNNLNDAVDALIDYRVREARKDELHESLDNLCKLPTELIDSSEETRTIWNHQIMYFNARDAQLTTNHKGGDRA